jgi:hypothetical protein
MSTRAQSAAAVSRQNSSQGENSDLGETETISSQNSSADENLTINLIPEADQISSQNLLFQNFSSITSLIWQLIRSIFDETEDMSIISVLVKARKIALLNESADWFEWNRKLKKYLSMIGLWKILIDELSESSVNDSEKHLAWSEKQKQLEKLLDLILETSTRSLIERITGKNVIQQYKILENEYNKISINTFSQMYRPVFKCSLFYHKSV